MTSQNESGFLLPPDLPRKSWPRRHKVLTGLGIAAVVFIAAPIGTSLGSHPAAPVTQPSVPAPVSTAAPSTAASVAAVPAPSPDGTYLGACDYTLGNDPVDGTAVATGDVEVSNTGNIGISVRVSISWPQQGYSPLSMTKTVKVAPGQTDDVQFHMPLSYDQLSNLQNWQLGHPGESGCTYDGTIVSTYGSVSGG